MVLDIIALILGIIYTVRKLDVRKREASEFPHVDPALFEAWRSREAGAYSLASIACFAKLLLDYGFIYYAQRAALQPRIVQIVGLTLFVSWLAALVLAQVRAHRARKLRESLGINLDVRPPPRPSSE